MSDTILRATRDQLGAIVGLLRAADLPTADVDERIVFHVALDARGAVIGAVGLEALEACVLLRSLVVADSERGRGLGRELVVVALEAARPLGPEVFALTTTAARFFRELGFVDVERSHAPEALQRTAQFTSLCPSNATILRRSLE